MSAGEFIPDQVLVDLGKLSRLSLSRAGPISKRVEGGDGVQAGSANLNQIILE